MLVDRMKMLCATLLRFILLAIALATNKYTIAVNRQAIIVVKQASRQSRQVAWPLVLLRRTPCKCLSMGPLATLAVAIVLRLLVPAS